MAGSRLGFDRNHIELHQVLGVRLAADGRSGMPLRPDWEQPGSWPANRQAIPVIRSGYARMLIARAITSAAMTRDTTASVIISSLAHGLIAEMSVELNAVAVQKPSDR